jgi:type IV pilus assembly protein PilV
MKIEQGFSLIEILVSVLILSTGLLGLVGLQAKGLRDNISAYHSQQATQFAYNIIDRMRSNRLEANKNAASIYISKKPTDAQAKANCLKNVASGGGCNPTEMAENDLYEWNQMLINTFPMGQGTISFASTTSGGENIKDLCSRPLPIGYAIVITWDDNRDQKITSEDRCFRTDFQL